MFPASVSSALKMLVPIPVIAVRIEWDNMGEVQNPVLGT